MAKYLIFRTDRIGDFIFSRVITDAIKKNDTKSTIDFVCSEYNFNYIKNYKDIKNIYILKKNNFFVLVKLLFTINKNKYDKLIILDGKRRSIFFSIFTNAKKKYVLLKSFRSKFILNFFFDKYFVNSEVNSQFQNFTTLINYFNFKIPKKINYYNRYSFNNYNNKVINKKFSLLHLDEKWFEGYYFNDFNFMNLNHQNFNLLIKSIFNKKNIDLIITTGSVSIHQLKLIKKVHFNKINKNLYISKKFGKKLIIIENTSFRDLENIVKRSKLLICCEGAISHVSNSFDIKTIALVQDLKFGSFWTAHMNNIKLIPRSNIKNICNLINKI